MDKNTIYNKIKEIMISEFELAEDSISLNARLLTDLDLDSLDMVDLVIKISEFTNEKIDPGIFKDAINIQDLVDAIEPFWKE